MLPLIQHISLTLSRSVSLSLFHSFIPAISIAPLQVLYYSEALPTTARILYRSFTPRRTGNLPKVAARAEVEPTTLRLKVIVSTKAPPRPTIYVFLFLSLSLSLSLFLHSLTLCLSFSLFLSLSLSICISLTPPQPFTFLLPAYFVTSSHSIG